MRKYWAVYRLRFERTFMYRGSVIIFLLSNLLLLITLVAVWLAARTNGQMGGYTKNGLVSYYLLGSLINSIVFWYAGWSIREDIRNGEIGAKVLTKPISYYWQKFFEEFSWHTVSPIFALIPILAVAFFLRANLVINFTPQIFLPMMVAVSLASWIFFNLTSSFGLLTFWFTETAGIFNLIFAGVFLLGGQAIPISFFPGKLHDLVILLPFRYIYSFPLEIYSGKLTDWQIVSGLVVQASWVALFGLFYFFLWRRGLARYTSYGA